MKMKIRGGGGRITSLMAETFKKLSSFFSSLPRAVSELYKQRKAKAEVKEKAQAMYERLKENFLNRLTYDDLRTLYQTHIGGWYIEKPQKTDMIRKLTAVMSVEDVYNALISLGYRDYALVYSKSLSFIEGWYSATIAAVNQQGGVEIKEEVEEERERREVVDRLVSLIQRFLSRHSSFTSERAFHLQLLSYLEGFADTFEQEYGVSMILDSEQVVDEHGRIDLMLEFPDGYRVGVELKNVLHSPDRVLGQLYKYSKHFNEVILVVVSMEPHVRQTLESFINDAGLPVTIIEGGRDEAR